MEEIDRDAEFSVKQLKANLKATLQKSGVLGSVKAQIRQEFINSLSTRERKTLGKLGELTISDRILFSAIFELLNNRGLMNSVSVFLAETGLDPKHSLLSINEVGQLIKLNEISSVIQYLQSGRSTNQLDSCLVDPVMLESKKVTILDLLVRFCTTSRETHKDVGTQMEGGTQSAREALEESLQELRSSFRASQTDAPTAAATIQERMIAYQRDCERRLQSEVTAQVAHMRETELTRVRLEEAAKARTEMDALRKRLELDYTRRLQAMVDSETALSQRIADQEQSAQRSLHAARQQMQREIDELRAREAAAMRRLELEAQGVTMLELRLKESLSVVERREADIARRERAMEEARERAVEEARREATTQVQAQLELLSRERAALLQDRQAFLDQQAAHSALVEGARGVREQLRQARDELMAREEELQSLDRQRQRMELQRRQEEDLVRKLVAQVDPAMAQQSISEQVVALVRQNAALEVRLAECGDAFALQQRLEDEQKERRAAQGEAEALKERLLADQLALQREREEAERMVSTERAKAAGASLKVDELRQLLRDKTQAMDTLRRQLASQGEGGGGPGASVRGQARAVAAGRSVRVESGNGSDRRALELLRESGRSSDAVAELAEGRAEQLTSALLEQVMRRLQGSAAPLAYTVMTGAPHFPGHTSYAPMQATPNDAQAQQQAQQRERDEERRRAAEMEMEMAEALHKERLRAAALAAAVEQQRLASERAALQAERHRLEAEDRARQQAFLLYQQQPRGSPPPQALSQGTEQPDLPLLVQASGPMPLPATFKPPSGRSAVPSDGPVYLDGSAVEPPSTTSEEPSATTAGTVRISPLGSTSSIPTAVSANTFSPGTSDLPGRGFTRAESALPGAAQEEGHPINSQPMVELPESSDSSVSSEPGGPIGGTWAGDRTEAGVAVDAAAAAPVQVLQGEGNEAEQAAERKDEEKRALAERQKQEEVRAAAEREEREKREEREEREVRERQLRAAEQEAELQRQRTAEERAATERAAQEEAQKRREDAEAETRAAADADAARKEAAAAVTVAEEAAKREAEEKMAAEREAAEREAAEREAEEQRKRDEDAAAIQEARMKVLERRRQRQQRDGVLSSSMPSSLQSVAAAHQQDGGSDDSGVAHSSTSASQQPSNSYSYSATSLLRSNMQPQVSTSLDSASITATGLLGRAQPARTLFGSNNPSFQSLQDDSSSEGSGAQLEVGDVSDDREGDRSIW